MCHRGSYRTRDGTFRVPGDGTVPGGQGAGGANVVRSGQSCGTSGRRPRLYHSNEVRN